MSSRVCSLPVAHVTYINHCTYMCATGRHRSHISTSTIRLSLCKGIFRLALHKFRPHLAFLCFGHASYNYRVMHYVITAHVPDLRIGEQSESHTESDPRWGWLVWLVRLVPFVNSCPHFIYFLASVFSKRWEQSFKEFYTQNHSANYIPLNVAGSRADFAMYSVQGKLDKDY